MAFILTSCWQVPSIRYLLLGTRYLSTKSIKDVKTIQIYKTPIGRLVVGAKIFSLTSSGLVLAAQPFIMSASTVAIAPIFIASIAFACLTPLLLHTLTGPTVFSIDCLMEDEEQGNETFVAHTKSLFLQNRCITFSIKDIDYSLGSLSFANMTVNGGRTPLLILESGFVSQKWRTRILGLDKPIKWT